VVSAWGRQAESIDDGPVLHLRQLVQVVTLLVRAAQGGADGVQVWWAGREGGEGRRVVADRASRSASTVASRSAATSNVSYVDPIGSEP
jgi:hypothetical protein